MAWKRAQIDGLLVEPYLQLGPAPQPHSGDLCILWHTEDGDIPWSLEYREVSEPVWRTAAPVERRQIAIPGVTTHLVHRAALGDLNPGAEFAYRLRRKEKIVFESNGQARRGPEQPHRFVAFGDCAANTFDQRLIAYQTYKANPDFVLITGDIVYTRGRIAEYSERFWPVYNAGTPFPVKPRPATDTPVRGCGG